MVARITAPRVGLGTPESEALHPVEVQPDVWEVRVDPCWRFLIVRRPGAYVSILQLTADWYPPRIVEYCLLEDCDTQLEALEQIRRAAAMGPSLDGLRTFMDMAIERINKNPDTYDPETVERLQVRDYDIRLLTAVNSIDDETLFEAAASLADGWTDAIDELLKTAERNLG